MFILFVIFFVMFFIASLFYLLNALGNVAQGVFIKYYTFDVDLYQFILLRSIISIVLLLPFAFKFFNLYSNNSALKINIIISICSCLDTFLWNTGLKNTPVNIGTLILLLVPIWIVILSRLILKEKEESFFNISVLLLCLIGVIFSIGKDLYFVDDQFNFTIGPFLIFINTIVIAFSLVLQKKFSTVRPLPFALFSNNLMLLVFMLFASKFTLPELTIKTMLFALMIAIFDIFEYLGVYVAYQMVPLVWLQPLRFIRIPISIALSYAFLNESITFYQFVAISVIISSNSLLFINRFCVYLKNKKLKNNTI